MCGDAVGRINCGQRNRSINLTDLFDRITLTPIFNGRFISTVPRYRSPYPARNNTIVSKMAPLYSILVRFGYYRVSKCKASSYDDSKHYIYTLKTIYFFTFLLGKFYSHFRSIDFSFIFFLKYQGLFIGKRL